MSAEKTPKEKGQELAAEHVEKLREAAGPATYVVQECTTLALEPGDEAREWWSDIATVQVPAKTKRETVIKQALAAAGIDLRPDGGATRLRVLDARSAHVSVVSAVQAAPTVVIE